MALELHEARLCASCGLPRHICHDPNIEWRAEGPDRCHATTAVILARERHGETSQPQALSWQPVRRDLVEHVPGDPVGTVRHQGEQHPGHDGHDGDDQHGLR